MAQGPIMHSGVIKCRCEVIVQLKVSWDKGWVSSYRTFSHTSSLAVVVEARLQQSIQHRLLYY